MKVRKLISKYFDAIFKKDKTSERKFYSKLLKKSLKHKKTHRIR